jgi:hypothetical protein
VSFMRISIHPSFSCLWKARGEAFGRRSTSKGLYVPPGVPRARARRRSAIPFLSATPRAPRSRTPSRGFVKKMLRADMPNDERRARRGARFGTPQLCRIARAVPRGPTSHAPARSCPRRDVVLENAEESRRLCRTRRSFASARLAAAHLAVCPADSRRGTALVDLVLPSSHRVVLATRDVRIGRPADYAGPSRSDESSDVYVDGDLDLNLGAPTVDDHTIFVSIATTLSRHRIPSS